MVEHSFLADEHFPEPSCRRLRKLGHTVHLVTAIDFQREERPLDEEIVRHADENGLIILTWDSDFRRLHEQGVAHMGIIWCAAGVGEEYFHHLADEIHEHVKDKKSLKRTLVRLPSPPPPKKPR